LTEANPLDRHFEVNTIGEYKLQHSGTYIVRKNSELSINPDIEGGHFKLRLKFTPDGDPGQIVWRGENGGLLLLFNPSPSTPAFATPEPIEITVANGLRYFVDASCVQTAIAIYLVTIHILTKEAANASA
jgi:hypothetical protein